MIEVQSIHKRFHDQEVLKGVSLNVEAGQVVYPKFDFGFDSHQ